MGYDDLKDKSISECFELILRSDVFDDCICDIIQLIIDNNLSVNNINIVLNKYGVKHISHIKSELMDVVIRYVRITLQDSVITPYEKNNIERLKLLFKIREGDFYKYKRNDIKGIIEPELQRLYFDNNIDKEEALHRFELQDIFDLSYSEMDKFKEKEVKRALKEGASITNLDTAKYPKDI